MRHQPLSHPCPSLPVLPADVAPIAAPSAPVETPAENCASVLLPSSSHTETAADQHKRAGGGLLGSAPRQPEATVLSAGQSGHSNSTDSETVLATQFFERQKAAETEAQRARADETRARVFSIMQYERHPVTGEVMVTEDLLRTGCAMGSIRRWALIRHDRDVGPGGVSKPPHWHVTVQLDHARTIRQISDWFTVPAARIRVPSEEKAPYAGPGARDRAFFDYLRYLTHDNGDPSDSKVKYAREEVRVHDESIWEALDEHMARRRSAGGGSRRMTAIDALAMAIQEEGLSLREAKERDPLSYNRAESRMKASRGTYLQTQDAPEAVLNFYIYGPGGVGKDLLAKALARALAPEERPYFKLGGENVSWENYDGEPVVIWEEMRVGDMIRAAKSRGMLFRILGPWREPDEAPIVNIKGSRTKLVNRVNIVTGPEDYGTFLRGLAGEYESFSGGVRVLHRAENVAQGFRRFPLIIPVSEGEFHIFVNSGVLKGTREYESYEKYLHFRQNLEGIARRAKAISDRNRASSVRHEIEQRTVAPIVAQARRVTDPEVEPVDAEVVLAEFEMVGTQKSRDEVIADEVKAWRERAAAERAQWASQWGPDGDPPYGLYDSWVDTYCAWAAENGGPAAARDKFIRGEVPPPPECPLPPPSSAPGIAFG